MIVVALVQSASTSTWAWLVQLFPVAGIIAIFYFIVIRPASQQRRKTEAMLQALKKGDRVLTSAGIYGTVQGVENEIVWLKIAENVKIRVAKSAIASLVNEPAGE
jgi:preprotein translocase subunit YajC